MICAGASDGFTIPLLNITQELDSTDISGHGLIQACLSSGNPPLLRRLIQRGVNLYQVNTQGQTYLHVAAKLGANWSVKILTDFAPELSNMRDYQGNTALMLAAAHGEWRTLVTLLPLTNRKLLTDNSGTSILHETVYGGTKGVLQKVLAYCSANDICAMDSTGRTSLEIADVFKKGEFKRMILLRLEELRLEDGLM